MRLCTNSAFLQHSPPLFKKLKCLSVHDIHNVSKAVFMYKFKNNMLPCNFDNYFVTSSAIHNYGTRSSDLYRPFNFSTDLAKNTIRGQGPILWNGIDSSISESKSIKIFKSFYKRKLLSSYV